LFFAWAAVVIDAWLATWRALSPRELPRTAARAWQSLPGDAIGWIVMRGCGIEAPTREVEAAGRTVAVVEDPRIGRWLELGLLPIAAQTLGRYVLSRGPIPEETFEHELEHVRQWSRLGPLYLPLYFGSSAVVFVRGGRPYADNAFEAAARRRAASEMEARRAAPR
jgi:hypothetical protein